MKPRRSLGRQQGVVDVLLEHPSISRKHAILQHGQNGEYTRTEHEHMSSWRGAESWSLYCFGTSDCRVESSHSRLLWGFYFRAAAVRPRTFSSGNTMSLGTVLPEGAMR